MVIWPHDRAAGDLVHTRNLAVSTRTVLGHKTRIETAEVFGTTEGCQDTEIVQRTTRGTLFQHESRRS